MILGLILSVVLVVIAAVHLLWAIGYWFPITDEAALAIFNAQAERICDTYAATPALRAQGVHTISTDEMTGIQALERIAPTLPTGPGLIERLEFEYIRHGTLTFIFNFDVVTGQLVACTARPTRCPTARRRPPTDRAVSSRGESRHVR